jgi:hypothetical protein
LTTINSSGFSRDARLSFLVAQSARPEASTLAILALLHPLAQRVQVVIDQCFFRRKYDAKQEADLDELAADVLGVVQETLGSDGAQLWLVRRT